MPEFCTDLFHTQVPLLVLNWGALKSFLHGDLLAFNFKQRLGVKLNRSVKQLLYSSMNIKKPCCDQDTETQLSSLWTHMLMLLREWLLPFAATFVELLEYNKHNRFIMNIKQIFFLWKVWFLSSGFLSFTRRWPLGWTGFGMSPEHFSKVTVA